MKRSMILFAAAFMIAAQTAPAQGPWNCGPWNSAAVTATLSGETLTVSGTGPMHNYNTSRPWRDVQDLITNIVIEDGVTHIGNRAFEDCINITSVTIPNSVTSIRGEAFHSCSNLASIIIPNSVDTIGSFAFYGNRFTSVTVPASVTSIGMGAFDGRSLTAIEVAQDNADYSSEDGVLFNKDKTTLIQYPLGKQGPYIIPDYVTYIGRQAFYQCTGLTSVTIPDGITFIDSGVFQECTGLTSVTIPGSVSSIGSTAFSGCTNLASITSLNPVPPSITFSNTFNGVNKTTAVLYVPQGSTEAYSEANNWKDFNNISAVSILSPNRVIPSSPVFDTQNPDMPFVNLTSGVFTAGPNPAAKSLGNVNFFWQGKGIENSTLYIYDASGSLVRKINITDKSTSKSGRREIGNWDLKDNSGRTVSEGTYLVKGTVKNRDGKKEKISLVLGVR